MLNSNPVDVAGLPSLDEESGTESRQVLSNDAAPVLDAFLQSCDAERFGIWSFRTLVRGIEWDPALFTHVLDECASKLGSTFEHASILTYACGNRATPVPHGYVPLSENERDRHSDALNFEETFAASGFTKPRQS